jgi:O-antigen ligase
LLVATVSLATVYVSFFRNSQDTSDSDETRLITASEVQERTTPASVLFGHGLGSGVPMRPVHMEMTYMEIFYKQGLLGLAVWGGTFAFIVRRYLSLKNSRFEVLATPYFISVVFVGIQSVANAFINNPIGLSMVFVSLSALEFLHSQLADGGTALRHPVSAKT